MPTWVQLVYLACGGLLHPRAQGALRARRPPATATCSARRPRSSRAVDAVLLPPHLDHVPLILARSRSAPSAASSAPARVQMTQMPQMVALFNGVGGGAAALVALLELHERASTPAATTSLVQPRRDRVHDRGRLGLLRRLGGHLRQAAGADDLAAGGLPGAADRLRRARSSARVVLVGARWSTDPRMWVGIVLGAGRPAGRRAAGAAGRRRRRTDRDLAAQRLHRPDRRRRRLRARPTCCCWSPARWSAPPARSSPC